LGVVAQILLVGFRQLFSIYC